MADNASYQAVQAKDRVFDFLRFRDVAMDVAKSPLPRPEATPTFGVPEDSFETFEMHRSRTGVRHGRTVLG
jgi:hypothetical protein